MEYDLPRHIPAESKPDTPEQDRECLHLKKGIDLRVDHWFDWAIAEDDEDDEDATANLSRIIIGECSPLEKPSEHIVSVIRFKRNRSRESMRNLETLIDTQDEVANVVRDDSLDEVSIELPVMAESFEYVEEAKKNPNSSPVLITALTYLSRLYVARQEIAKKLTGDGEFKDAYKFSWILKKVIDEN